MSNSYDSDDDDVLIVEGPHYASEQPDMSLFINRFEQELHAVLHQGTVEDVATTPPTVGAMILPGDDTDDDDAVEADLVMELADGDKAEGSKFRQLLDYLASHLDASKQSIQAVLVCLVNHWAHHRDQLLASLDGCPAIHAIGTQANLWNTALVVALLAVAFVVVPQMLPNKRSPSPTADLKAFVHHEKVHNPLSLSGLTNLGDLPTDRFQTYARASCVQAATVDQARNALLAGLYGIPDKVRHDVVSMAILEGVTSKNSMQDTHADIVEQGTAESFMAFWSTVYAPKNAPEAVYQTCAMVTGVTLLVAEQVAEWNVIHEQYQIGVEPCLCGYLYCEECPVFDTRVVRTPVLQRHSLSLKKQTELRQWMVYQAVQAAEHLLVDGTTNSDYQIGGDAGSKNTTLAAKSKWDAVASFAWTRPAAFPEANKHVKYDTSNK